MLRSKIQFIVKRSFDGCCEAKSSIQYSGALMDVEKQNPVYCKAELWWMLRSKIQFIVKRSFDGC
jgi:hypothetical protein